MYAGHSHSRVGLKTKITIARFTILNANDEMLLTTAETHLVHKRTKLRLGLPDMQA